MKHTTHEIWAMLADAEPGEYLYAVDTGDYGADDVVLATDEDAAVEIVADHCEIPAPDAWSAEAVDFDDLLRDLPPAETTLGAIRAFDGWQDSIGISDDETVFVLADGSVSVSPYANDDDIIVERYENPEWFAFLAKV